MDSVPEHNPKQASYKEKAAIKWNVNDLLAWIKDKRPDLLDDDKSEKLRKAEISGEVFLACAGDKEFFKNDCKLPPGTAVVLANLSRELVEEEAAGIKRNRQQAEDVEMSDAADMKRPREVKDAFKSGIPYQPPRPLLKTSGLNWENELDKTYVPIYFYLGGAGTGKSRHGSEFASSVQEAIRLYAERHAELHTDDDHCNLCDLYNELSQRLEKAFVFHVSFENGTSLTVKEKSKPLNAVGVRMLYQLLGGDIEDISSKYIATPRDVFRLVATAENVDLYNDFTGILVIDGIHSLITRASDRTDKASGFYEFLTQIADLSLWSPFIMTCVTATHLGPEDQFLAASHRMRVYLPLNRLDAPTWKADGSKVLNNDPGTHLLVDDVGGHARAIEAIADELARDPNRPQLNITELADSIIYTLKDRYSEAISMMRGNFLPVVQCILSRQPIRLQEFIPGSDLQWERITAPGLLWFEQIEEASGSEFDHDQWGYLVAPYMWLWLLARLLPPRNNKRLCQFLREWDFNDYQQLLHLQTG